jgi:hypothetical protein
MTMRALTIFGMTVFFCASFTAGQTQTREEYLRAYDQRVRYVISAYDTVQQAKFEVVAVRYATGNDVKLADSMFQELLKESRGDMFWMYPVIGAYLHGKDKMSPATRQAVRNAWKTYAPYRGDTENHWAMYHSSLYLAAEQWPGLPGSEWFNGKSSAENLAEARDYLEHWVGISTTIGQGEFDSPDYFPEYAVSMSLLADYAQDPAMRTRGNMMLDFILADFAADQLDGQYIGGFSRIYQPAVFKPLLSGASAFAYLFFGTGEPTQNSWVILPALGKYRLPEIIYKIATDRSTPYLHKERKRVRNVIRFGAEKNHPVYKQSYITADYGLGALQGGILQPIQQHTWGVRFVDGRPTTTIFGLHPYWSAYELGLFFPEELKPLIADVTLSKGTYNNPDKWTGGSPFERTFQNNNTLIVLYDIAPGTTTEHIDGFFPGNLEQRIVDPSGWIFCKAGRTFVGWFPLQEYVWIEEHDTPGQAKNVIGRPESLPPAKDPSNWRLRSYHPQNGYVIEVRSASEVGTFDKFCAALKSHIPKATLAPGKVRVDYTSLNSDTMHFAFPETRTLNGTAVDLSQYRLFEGPFLNAEVGSEKLSMTYKNLRRILDFKTLKVTE